MVLPRAAPAGLQVVLEVRVAAADLDRALERGLGQRRAPEIRVHDHARGIQRAPQRGRAGRPQLAQRPLDEVAGVVAGLDLLTRAREGGPRRLDRQRRGLAGQPLVPQQLVHGGQVAQLHRRLSLSTLVRGRWRRERSLECEARRCVAGLLVLVFASTSGAAARVGIGRMSVTPNRVSAGHDQRVQLRLPRRLGAAQRHDAGRRAARLDEAAAGRSGRSGLRRAAVGRLRRHAHLRDRRAADRDRDALPAATPLPPALPPGRRAPDLCRRLRLPHPDPTGGCAEEGARTARSARRSSRSCASAAPTRPGSS